MASAYDRDLDKNQANYQPLTPLTYLERAAKTFPDHTAIVHGSQRISYGQFWTRALKLASALRNTGIGKGDTVSVMLSNTPPMLEAHFGVPMVRAVLHSLNTRLDAAIIAFQLDHAESKVLIVDREFSGVVAEALKMKQRQNAALYVELLGRHPMFAHLADDALETRAVEQVPFVQVEATPVVRRERGQPSLVGSSAGPDEPVNVVPLGE